MCSCALSNLDSSCMACFVYNRPSMSCLQFTSVYSNDEVSKIGNAIVDNVEAAKVKAPLRQLKQRKGSK